MPEKIQLPGGGYAFVASPAEMSASERYRLLDPTINTLEDYQAAKLSELDELCTQAILGGFRSDALGEEHGYAFGDQDQANLTGMLAMLNADPNLQQMIWKTQDAGPLLHTREQFLKVCQDGLQFKNDHIARYWALKQQVQAAVSLEQIQSFVW
jgi:hypothetical protein